VGTFKQGFRPPAQWRLAFSDERQRGARSMDQLSAKVAVAALADPEQLRFAARRKIATPIEALRPPDRSDQRGSDDRPEPGDRG